MNIVLANRDYGPVSDGWGAHTTDEGLQLQQGLEVAGWKLCGVGYDDGCADVAELLRRHKPEVVFVQDVRDWLSTSNISFRKDLNFTNLEALRDVRAFTICKDAWGWDKEHGWIAETIDAKGILHYYAAGVVRECAAKWIQPYPMLRIHHSVDADLCSELWTTDRKRALVSGAKSAVYPLRDKAIHHAAQLGLDVRRHPGYGNRGADTPNYLRHVSQYRVHVATASKWEVAFRKIIESVALGCTPVTNLKASDRLPEIDDALIRVRTDCTFDELDAAIKLADAEWNADERLAWARKAWAYYDWRAAGDRNARLMEAVICMS